MVSLAVWHFTIGEGADFCKRRPLGFRSKKHLKCATKGDCFRECRVCFCNEDRKIEGQQCDGPLTCS